ncbi:BatA domain-containing protein [Hymenobacter sp. CRA2]|uniref:BatA domain-containing protein n=1 Tax=Hymenobacter sp. CRA2 TaxID=1955620 RepID=UPI00098FF8E6|nr:BatA domain-containing protein [Hymenobacter sp. CRA2]OON68418.1 hypothetical protein B0919_12195 [Hymenobacter sp. CRA2]
MALAHPWYLLGLIALGIPVILHLFELRRPQQILFTNVEFIREVKLVTAKQRRLQELLVLVLRLAFLTLLVLLFCQPFIPAKQQAQTANQGVNVVIDNSPSMSVEANDGKSLLEEAIVEMRRTEQAFPPTAQYRIWNSSASHSNISADKFADQLDRMDISGASTGVSEQLGRLTAQTSVARAATFVVSDFQKTDLSPRQIKSLGTTGEVYLLPLMAQPVANVYVDSVYMTEEFVRTNVDFPLHVRLRNGGSKDAATVQIRVLIGEQQVAAYEASVRATSSVENVVRVRLSRDAVQLCRVEIEEQPVSFDNLYYFTLNPVGRIRVLDASAGAAPTQKLYPNETTFAYSLLRPEALSATAAEGADVVILQSNAQVGGRARSVLRQFVQQGGSVVAMPPTTAAGRGAYEQLMGDLGVAAVRWNTVNAVQQELAVPSQQNPFFKDVFAEQARQPEMPKATPLLSWGRSTTDILQFRDGQPFLSGFRSGEGMVYLFASPLQAGFSTFAEHPLFVPVMYRLATLSKSSGQLPAYRLTDRAVVLKQPTAAKGAGEQVYKLSNDSSSFIPAYQVRNGRLYLQLPATMRRAGIYQLTQNGKAVTTLAFNVDKKESELAHYSAEELRQLTAAYPNIHVYEAGGERSAAAQLAEDRNGTPLWRYCLVGALLCLLGEVLVLRFGRRRERPVAQAA